jgi:hypothetical protein
MTVGKYFATSDNELRLLTDGELDMTNSSLKDFDWMPTLSVVPVIIKRNADVPLEGRKTLGILVGKVLDEVTKRNPAPAISRENRLFTPQAKQVYPRALLAVKAKLMQGGPLRLVEEPPPPDDPHAETDLKRIAVWERYREGSHHAKLMDDESYAFFDRRWFAFTKTEHYTRLNLTASGDVEAAVTWIVTSQ